MMNWRWMKKFFTCIEFKQGESSNEYEEIYRQPTKMENFTAWTNNQQGNEIFTDNRQVDTPIQTLFIRLEVCYLPFHFRKKKIILRGRRNFQNTYATAYWEHLFVVVVFNFDKFLSLFYSYLLQCFTHWTLWTRNGNAEKGKEN